MVQSLFGMNFGFIALLGLLLVIYVIYDILVNQERMQAIEKLIWIAVVLVFNLIGLVVYLIVVKWQGKSLMNPR